MDGIGVSHEQDISHRSLVLESVNNEMPAKASYVNTLDIAYAVELICGFGQEIDNSTTARFITRRGFSFHQGADKPFDVCLSCVHEIFYLTSQILRKQVVGHG
jgi:hypothetical protein